MGLFDNVKYDFKGMVIVMDKSKEFVTGRILDVKRSITSDRVLIKYAPQIPLKHPKEKDAPEFCIVTTKKDNLIAMGEYEWGIFPIIIVLPDCIDEVPDKIMGNKKLSVLISERMADSDTKNAVIEANNRAMYALRDLMKKNPLSPLTEHASEFTKKIVEDNRELLKNEDKKD